MIIRVTKEFTFEMAHALLGYDGACRFIHGHSYGLSVTVKGHPVDVNNHPKNGMVIDFGILKSIVKQEVVDKFDHALVLNKNTPEDLIPKAGEMFDKMIMADYQPTSENMVTDFAKRIISKLPDGIKLVCIRLQETATSYAEWLAEDNY
ncbi:MAG: 6-carboxytetrahydropterin synthase [Bacteroidales bacterium]|nr:6-carboxytetrahydropterin synthase [Bacteroidales bacterium]